MCVLPDDDGNVTTATLAIALFVITRIFFHSPGINRLKRLHGGKDKQKKEKKRRRRKPSSWPYLVFRTVPIDEFRTASVV